MTLLEFARFQCVSNKALVNAFNMSDILLPTTTASENKSCLGIGVSYH
jgi:hypothetical protein